MSDDSNKLRRKDQTMKVNFQILSTDDSKESKIINEYLYKESIY